MIRYRLRPRPGPRLVEDAGVATIIRPGSRARGLICRVAGSHDWTRWERSASGWPMRRCRTCREEQARLDPSW